MDICEGVKRIKAMKKISITEENFETILQQMQKICSKYKMIRYERYDSEDGHVMCKHSPIVFNISHRIYLPHCECEYVGVTKHIFREEYEKGNTDSRAYSYYLLNLNLDTPSLIHLSLNDDDIECTLVSKAQIRFLPFKLGFIIYSRTELDTCNDTYNCTARILFISNILNGRIKDIYAEKTIRDNKWEEYFKNWKEPIKNYYADPEELANEILEDMNKSLGGE